MKKKLKEKKMIPMLDAGHGGMILGEYATPGKRSPDWDKGVLYEGMFNRWVVNRVIERLDRLNIPYVHLSPDYTDKSLKARVRDSNGVYRSRKDTYTVSIHANGGGGEGIEVFTSPGQTMSDAIAEVFLNNLKSVHRIRADKSDGDMDKEANFFMLTQTSSPSILIECGFMDHKGDYDKLWSEDYLVNLVNAIVESIRQLYEEEC